MRLEELIAGLPVRVVSGRAEGVRICDLTEDSRTVVPGSLFVARRGLRTDGKRFVRDALEAGAVSVLTDDEALVASVGERTLRGAPVLCCDDVMAVCAALGERFHGRPSERLRLAGVTGTNGKTTTACLIHRVCNDAGMRCGLIGTVLVDNGRETGPSSMTTPPALETSRLLGEMVEAGCEACAMEISSHALDQKRADALRLRVGVFTNLTGDHLDYHGTMEAYASAKARLFALLPADGVAIVNADDPACERMVRDCRARVVRCSARGAPGAGARVEVRSMDMGGMRLAIEAPWGGFDARVGLIGAYNAMNILQACAGAWALGVSPADIERAVARLAAPPGRLERVPDPRGELAVFVDYAHTDDALRNVLTTVAAAMGRGGHHAASLRETAGTEHPSPSRLWVVFGCGGERDRTKRPRMGRVASEIADRVVVTSDNPRTEDPRAIIDEILAGIPDGRRSAVTVEPDRRAAIALAVRAGEPGDVVVIAGKGHETVQILPDGRGGRCSVHFDDREVAAEALASRRARRGGCAS
jgi:UDP-N-acetylmuramoyl-L-alanyl-D-glutamate--2,6-diaminopimelate ligase